MVFSACLFIKACLLILPAPVWHYLVPAAYMLYGSIYVKSSVLESTLEVLPGRPQSEKTLYWADTEHIGSDKK